MVTIWVSVISVLGRNMWLPDPSYAGGSMTFVSGSASHVLWNCAGVATIVLQQMTDGLMVRPNGSNVATECESYPLCSSCTVVESCGTAFMSSLHPPSCGSQISVSIILHSSLRSFQPRAKSVLWIVAAAVTGPNPFTGVSSDLPLALYATSVFLSTALTCMICYRLLRHASTMKEYLGEQFASPYCTTVTFTIESVLPYTLTTLTGIALLVSFGLMNQVGMTLWCVYTPMIVRRGSPVSWIYKRLLTGS